MVVSPNLKTLPTLRLSALRRAVARFGNRNGPWWKATGLSCVERVLGCRGCSSRKEEMSRYSERLEAGPSCCGVLSPGVGSLSQPLNGGRRFSSVGSPTMFLSGLRLMLHTILLNTFPSSPEWRVIGVALNQEIPGTPSSSKKNPAL